jgi:hemoglobin/transferrin/lactoferrin receptor protein
MSESAIEALSGSSAIDNEQLDQQFQADSVSQIMRTIPGVTTQENGLDTAQAINIRGLQDFGRVNVLVEGARQNFQRSGHNADGTFYLEAEMIKRVDVTRGPTSTIYGSGAIGGVAAFELLDADDILMPGEYAAVRTRTRYGTNGNSRLGSATGAVRVGNFDVLGQLNGRWSDDYEDGGGTTIEHSGDTTKSGLVKGRWEFAPGHRVTGTFVDYQSNFVDQTDDATEWDTAVENKQYTLGYTFARPDTPLVDFSAKVYKNLTNVDQASQTTSDLFPYLYDRGFKVETTGFDVFNTSRFEFESTKFALTYGGDGFEDRVSNFTENPDDLAFNSTPSGRRSAMGAFVQGKATFFDTIDVIAALRYDQYELKSGETSSDGERVSPKLTVGYTPFSGVTFFTTYAEGYRAPSVTETLVQGIHDYKNPYFPGFILIPNPSLRPEVAHNMEAGINLKKDNVFVSRDALRAKVVAFRNKVDDYIDADLRECDSQDENDPCYDTKFTHLYQYVNVPKATIEGVEFEAMYDARRWFIEVGAHRIRGENDDTGEPLAAIPADQITLTIGGRALEERLVFGTRMRLVAGQDRVAIGAEGRPINDPTDGYAIVDLFGEYAMNENTTINVNIDNLFDKEYRQYLNLENDPGFSARVGLTMRLGVQ